MSTGTRSNTIDFNRAKLIARVAEILPRLEPGDDIHGRLTRKLQMTLDVSEQLSLFMEALSELVEVDGVRYLHEAPHIHLQSERLGMHRCQYNLTLQGDGLGEISFGRGKRFLEPELRVIEQMLSILVYPLRNALLYRRALNAALTDALTGIDNKRSFDNQIQREMDLARRHKGDLSLILLDLDHFKSINDTHGHVVGDEVLKEVAARIQTTCRQSDLCFRLGGEEFAVILSHTDTEGARIIAERVREAVNATPVEVQGRSVKVTVSLGVTSFYYDDSSRELFSRADLALYCAKAQGRNQTSVQELPEHP